MSSEAVTERLRLMGELCDKMLDEKRVAEEATDVELRLRLSKATITRVRTGSGSDRDSRWWRDSTE